MICVKELSRSYAEFLAVDRVSFDIKPGEIVGLLGHNGAGKTTIMKMLSGYLEPSAGSIEVDGIDLANNPRAVQNRLGYLPESLPVYPEMSVADYLDYAATLKGLRGTARHSGVRKAVSSTELGGRLLDRIATLSRGYKQRVGVAQALLGSPRVLILDEPTNGLDPTQTQHMRELITGLAEQATVILSTHIMQEVDAICDRALILRAGQLVVDQELKQLRASGQLRVATSLTADQLRAALPQHACHADNNSILIELSAHDDSNAVSAQVARAIADAGGDLYRLTPEIRDLESVFREVSTDPSLVGRELQLPQEVHGYVA